MLPFKDISTYQGNYNMTTNSDVMIMIKMSGGDAGLYYDSHAANNYNNAVKTNKIPFGYHFYGGQDPVTEADYFVKAMSPLADGDGLAVDIERGSTWNPQTDPGAVAKVAAFVNHIHDKTGVWPWVYMNMSTANMYDWSPVFNNCGYWCAAPSYGFDATLPVKYPQIAQQGPVVNGVDTDAFFGTIEQLRKYTFHAQAPTPSAPVSEPAPVPPAPPSVVPEPSPVPVVPAEPPVTIPPSTSPPTPPISTPTPVITVTTKPPHRSWWLTRLLKAFTNLFKRSKI